jgi:uncharacterized protein YraI
MTTATTTTGLNLRSGPGTQFSVIEVLPPHTVCDVLAQQGDWINVRVQGQDGFVHHSFVVLDGQGSPGGFISSQPDGTAAGGATGGGRRPAQPAATRRQG